MRKTTDFLPDLYEVDETAWLDEMADIIEQRRYNELDYAHLGEFLADMARRDRREVESRLEVLLTHVLKWTHQPHKRTPSRRGTILTQAHELARLLESGALRNHAESVLGKVYLESVAVASAETELIAAMFPKECPCTVEQLLAAEVLDS